jgi:hypothetical protein
MTHPMLGIGVVCACVCVCAQNADRFDSEIIYDRDFDYDYFGFKVGAAACDMGWAHVIFCLVWGAPL